MNPITAAMETPSFATPLPTGEYQPPTVRFIGTVADLTRGSGTGPGSFSATPSARLKDLLDQKDRDGNRY